MIVRAKKSLGQNFLHDKKVLKLISECADIRDKEILEIGPGTGNLTSEILNKKPKKFFIVEKDKNLSLLLKKNFAAFLSEFSKYFKKSMCGRFELKTKFEKLPKVLKQDYPSGLDSKYDTQSLIRPNDPVLVIKNEGRIKTTFMTWGFISPWARDPFDKERPRPFNARSETVEEKKLFSGSWKHKRCLIPASGFFEKKYRVRKSNYETFWLGGIWSKWTSPDGAELESCCVLTTEPNDLIKPIHHRMPVIVPNGYEEQWTEQAKDADELGGLFAIMMSWSPEVG